MSQREDIRIPSDDEQLAAYVYRPAAADRCHFHLQAVRDKFDTPILILGDFDDELCDTSVVELLQASSQLDRVVGDTNTIKRFDTEPADYRGGDNCVYNACWRFRHRRTPAPSTSNRLGGRSAPRLRGANHVERPDHCRGRRRADHCAALR